MARVVKERRSPTAGMSPRLILSACRHTRTVRPLGDEPLVSVVASDVVHYAQLCDRSIVSGSFVPENLACCCDRVE